MVRKKYKGVSNDKERSKAKLIQAVGKVIKTKGYTGLTATNIAKTAGLSRRLISLYFGSVDNLIRIYITGQDYWVAAAENAEKKLSEKKPKSTKSILEALLTSLFEYLSNNDEMQKVVLWQVSESNEIMNKICTEREKLSNSFFHLADEELEESGKPNTDLRSVASLLLGGIYFTVLHAKADNSTFCEMNFNKTEDQERIKKAISNILDWTYEN